MKANDEVCHRKIKSRLMIFSHLIKKTNSEYF